MDFIIFPIEQLKIESKPYNSKVKYSHPAFTRKLPLGSTPCDYDKKEKLVEIEFKNGERRWLELKYFFGIVIYEVKDIYVKHPNKINQSISISGFEVFKVKRTLYWKLIFETIS